MGVKPTGDKAAFDALFELHKTEPDILVSNGFLERIRENTDLISELTEEESEFLDKSIHEAERSINLQITAAQEYSTALIEAEEKALELQRAKDEAETAWTEATEARQEAERLAAKESNSRKEIEQELESTKQYQMQSDRQRRQFVTAQAHGYPAWGLIGIFIIGIMLLMWFEKPGTDVLVPVLAGVLGTMIGAYAAGFQSLFTPMVREERKPSSAKVQNADSVNVS